METWKVKVPFAGMITMLVEAETEEDASQLAVELIRGDELEELGDDVSWDYDVYGESGREEGPVAQLQVEPYDGEEEEEEDGES